MQCQLLQLPKHLAVQFNEGDMNPMQIETFDKLCEQTERIPTM